MNMDTVNEFIRLDKKKKDLNAEVKLTQKKLDKLSDEIMEEMDEDGLDNIKKSDGRTVYIHERISGAPINGDKQASIVWLDENGHGHIVEESYNTIRLNSLLSELDKTEGGIPEEFGEAFTVHRIHSLRVRGNK